MGGGWGVGALGAAAEVADGDEAVLAEGDDAGLIEPEADGDEFVGFGARSHVDASEDDEEAGGAFGDAWAGVFGKECVDGGGVEA